MPYEESIISRSADGLDAHGLHKINNNKFITPKRIFISLELFEILYKSIFDLCSKLLMNNF